MRAQLDPRRWTTLNLRDKHSGRVAGMKEIFGKGPSPERARAADFIDSHCSRRHCQFTPVGEKPLRRRCHLTALQAAIRSGNRGHRCGQAVDTAEQFRHALLAAALNATKGLLP